MAPRADFTCRMCAIDNGTLEPVRHEDLPVDSKFCPACGTKKDDGFERLYEGINVTRNITKKVGRIVDKKLEPMYEKHSVQKASAQSFEQDSKVAMEKAYEKATTEERKKMEPVMTGRALPASQVFGTLSPQARADVRECVTPALLNRKVSPEFVK